MKLIYLLMSLFLISCAGVKKKEITYKVKGIDHIGYIASGVEKGEKKPGVIIVHEWWGHNEYARSRADKLAKLGYVAMAIDMYGEGKQANHPKDAGAFAKKTMSNFKLAKKKFKNALNILKKRDDVDKNKIVAIGYCFGGGVVLNMMRAGLDLDLVASFHGSLNAAVKARKNKFKGKVLVYNGGADPMVKPKDISAFKSEMEKLNINYSFVNYPGALHAFTNKGADEYGKKFNLPLGYNKVADEKSWSDFLDELRQL
jgi:dienelactone hydrolase